MTDEVDRLADWMEDGDDDRVDVTEELVRKMRARFLLASTANVGDSIVCPTCGKTHIKTTYNKVFCSNGRTNKGRANCKDRYHNTVSEERRDRAVYYNGGQ